MTSEPSATADLELFATSFDSKSRARAFSALVKSKQHHRAANTPTFARGVEALLRAATSSDQASDRLAALALLLRIAALIKAWQQRILDRLSAELEAPPPPIELAPDPDDRFYLATASRLTTQPWVRAYLATGAANEEGSERVRLKCVEGVFRLSKTLAGALSELTPPLVQLNFTTEKPGESKARRLRRVLNAVNSVYGANPIEPGQSPGRALRILLDSLTRQQTAEVPQPVTDELAEEALRLTQNIVRARFSSVTSAETYAAMEVARGWYRDHGWREFAAASPSAKLIARDLKGALELLARAGVADDGLLARLALAAGSMDRAREAAGDVLARNPGLPEEIDAWLSGRPARRKSALAAESDATQLGELLANLLVDCARLREMEDVIDRDALPEVKVLAPRAAVHFARLLGLVQSIRNSIESAGSLRSFSVTGKAGDIVEFSPLQHAMAEGSTLGARTVRIVQPAVEAPGGAAGRRILRKAIVEPIQHEE